jgi:exosortase family protein XrtF
MWTEFKPSILFLTKFLGLYVVLNTAYGLYLRSYDPGPDPWTHVVSYHSALVLDAAGVTVQVQDKDDEATTWLLEGEQAVLAVFEGCNGLNTAIIFVAFIIAFGNIRWPALWFIPLGLFVIHAVNLGRISLLFLISKYRPEQMYFFHKYLFTAIIYGIIFLLWVFWVRCFISWNVKRDSK